jgi:hypothetical protein
MKRIFLLALGALMVAASMAGFIGLSNYYIADLDANKVKQSQVAQVTAVAQVSVSPPEKAFAPVAVHVPGGDVEDE